MDEYGVKCILHAYRSSCLFGIHRFVSSKQALRAGRWSRSRVSSTTTGLHQFNVHQFQYFSHHPLSLHLLNSTRRCLSNENPGFTILEIPPPPRLLDLEVDDHASVEGEKNSTTSSRTYTRGRTHSLRPTASLSHRPSHLADYSPSCPSLKHHRRATKTPR